LTAFSLLVFREKRRNSLRQINPSSAFLEPLQGEPARCVARFRLAAFESPSRIAAERTSGHVATAMACDASITATGKRRQRAIDGRTTRHQGYGLSQSCRAMIECIFGCSDRI
jgi:hypothetical protein